MTNEPGLINVRLKSYLLSYYLAYYVAYYLAYYLTRFLAEYQITINKIKQSPAQQPLIYLFPQSHQNLFFGSAHLNLRYSKLFRHLHLRLFAEIP